MRKINPATVVEQIQAILGDTSELSETWINATFDDDMGIFERWSDERIRREYRAWVASL